LLAAAELHVAGHHNLVNALAALALGHALGWPLANMVDGLRSYHGLPHRAQLVVKRAGVTWVNDSKGTNVGAAIAAIEGMSGQVVWIGGGDGKGADFKPLRDVLMRKARAAILIGVDAGKIGQALAGIPVPLIRTSTLQKAVRHAATVAQPGDSVLLSPACASFDMFNDYEHRGRVFAKAVLGLQS
jgi:UDP-N-acetylmuramoylalanine--D-glutamate ligase